MFQAGLVLLAYLSFTPPVSEGSRPLDVLEVQDWRKLSGLYDSIALGETPSTGLPEEYFIVHGASSLQIKGFLDGKERQMDMFR